MGASTTNASNGRSDEGWTELIRSFLADATGLPENQFDPERQFAELGLDSFSAQQLRRLLFQHSSVQLPLTSFLGAQTPRAVIKALDSQASTAPGGGAPAVQSAVPPPAPPPATLTPAELTDSAPLTAVQAAYWVGRGPDFPLGNVATFWYQEYDRGPLDRGGRDVEADVDHLEAAWNRLVDHHPMLRATVGRDGRQRCAPPGQRYAIERTDVRHLPPETVRQCLAQLRHDHSHQLRDPQTWPLFDLHAVYLPDGTTRLLLGFDILVLDFASWRLLMVQWGQLVREPERALPTPPATFLETVHRRLTDQTERAGRERARQYWAAQAADLPPGPQLPLIRPAKDISAPRFTRFARTLDPADWSRLRARCVEHGVSPTAMLLAAFGLALHRWGSDDQFAINTTLFDRPENVPGIEQVVGDFTTTSLVTMPAIDLLKWPGFAEYARQVNHQFWEAIDHRAFSAVELPRDLAGQGDVRTVDHPVVFTSGLGVGDEAAPLRWLGVEVFGLSQTPQVLIDHLVWQEDEELRVVFDVVAEAFPAGFLDGLVDAEHQLLRLLAADPDSWHASDLGWAPDFSRPQPPRANPFPGVGPLLDHPRRQAAARRATAPALLEPHSALTHGELDRRARDVAAYLARLGVRTNDLVLVAMPKCPAQIIAVLAIELAGAGYVPVNPDWPAVRIGAVCEKAGISHALMLDEVTAALPAQVAVGVLDRAGRPVDASAKLPTPPAASTPPGSEDLAYVIFTSGSTGVPKGVAIEHRQARTTIDDITDRFAITAQDRVLGLSALSFDLSVYDIFGLLGAGGALILPDEARQRDPQHWCELIERFEVTVWNTAPALLEILVEYAESDPDAAGELSSLRLVMLSGDWIPVTLPDRFRALVPGARVVSLGGATEAAIWSIAYPIDEVKPDWPSIPYGKPLTGQFFHILDDAGRPCPMGEVGELYIAGDGVARGYIGDPVQTGERFITHPALGQRIYHTGDLGRWRYDGTIQFLGRADRQVKVNGHRIELGEIESVLGRLPAVRQSVASALPGPDGRPRLVAHVATGEAAEESTLIGALREQLPDYMVPSRLVVLSQMPVTDNGKIDYERLPNPFQPKLSAPAQPAAGPTPPTAQKESAPRPAARTTASSPLIQALHDILGSDLDTSAGLVAAGATSLGVVRLANTIEDLTGTRPSFQELIAFPSVRDLVEAYPPAAAPPASPTPAPPASPAPAAPAEADRPAAAPATGTAAGVADLPLPAPPGSDLELRMRLPADRPLADTLVDAGEWLRRLNLNASGAGYQTFERLAPGDGDLLEVRLTPMRTIAGPVPDAAAESAAATSQAAAQAAASGPQPASGRDPAPGPTPSRAARSSAAATEPFALTEMQLAYLLGRADTSLGNSVAPHYYTEVDVQDLDRARLATALRQLVDRHPMLRAVITPDTRQAVTEVPPEVPVTVVDLRDEPPAPRQQRLQQLRDQRSHVVADPARWPLFQIGVTLLDDRTSRLHLGLDLLFCDAQSAVILAEELFALYSGATLPPAPQVAFADWIEQVQAARSGERRQRAVEYWRQAANTLSDGPALPLRRPTEARYVRRRATLPGPLWSQLKRVAQAAGVTPASLLLTVFGEVLRLAGAGDRFTLVLTTFDRPATHQGVLGDYTSTVLLDIDHRQQQTFAERAAALQQRLFADLEHATGPHGVHGNEVLRELSARRRRQVPLPVVFSSGLGSTTTADGRGLDASELLDAFGRTAYAISQTPRVALDHQVFEQDGELRINWDAVDAAFPPGYLDVLLRVYLDALRVLADPAQWSKVDPSGLAAALADAPRASGDEIESGSRPAATDTRPVPRSTSAATERRIATAIAAELATDPAALRPDISFFDLGATSLTLVKVHRRLRDELGDALTVLDLFAYPSIRALAGHLAQARRPAEPAAGPPAAAGEAAARLSPAGPEPDPIIVASRLRGRNRRERLAAR